MRISDWSSDVCSSDLGTSFQYAQRPRREPSDGRRRPVAAQSAEPLQMRMTITTTATRYRPRDRTTRRGTCDLRWDSSDEAARPGRRTDRSEEHTSELQSLMRISYAVICLKKQKKKN